MRRAGIRVVVICLLLVPVVATGTGCRRLRTSGNGTSPTAPQGAGTLYDNSRELQSGGLTRTYSVHVPPSYDSASPAPLVIAYHGHGGTGEGMEKLSHLYEAADRKGFIVAYPDGIQHGWNDGRQSAPPMNVDDVGFTRDLVAAIESQYNIDRGRIFATGMSNGGFFCYRLACDAPDIFAAIAPVSALMGEALASSNTSTTPVSVLIIEGTADPFVPWHGGAVGGGAGGRGNALSAADTVAFWVRLDGCSATPSTVTLPDKDPSDGTSVKHDTYPGGRGGTEVELYTVDGGGHAWPGGWAYLGRRAIGNTSRDIDASAVILDFFASHPKQDSSGV
jgi:polyhydroxybutyrate depolymerase